MASVCRSEEIPASRGSVWAVAMDPARFPEWQSIHRGFVGDPPARLTEGDDFTQKVKVVGYRGHIDWHVDRIDEPNRLEMTGTGPMNSAVKGVLALEGSDPTTLSYEIGFEGAAVKATRKVLERSAAKAAERSLKSLKEIIE